MTDSIESKQRGRDHQPAPTGLKSASPPEQTKQIIIGLLTRAQVAHRLGTCPHTVQRLTRRGLLPAIIFNQRFIRYSPDVVEKFIESAATGGRA